MSNRPGPFLFAVALLIGVTVMLLMTRSTESPVAPAATGALDVAVPERHPAGEPLTVAITGASTELSAIDVVVDGTAGTRRLAVPVSGGSARLVLDESITATSGVLGVWVIAGADEAEAVVRIEPGPPVSPVVPLVGPKSIVADGADHAMVVVLVADAFGNPVPERRDLRVNAVRPGGRSEVGGVEVTGLVGWRRVFSGTLAGRSEISARLGPVAGPAADLDEVAGPPVAVTVQRADTDVARLLADGRRLHELVTEPLVDRFGNQVIDGTAVTVRIDEASGRRTATVPTIDGRARFFLEAPDAPGDVRVVAASSGVESAPLDLSFDAAVAVIPTRAHSAGGSWTVEVGPVSTVDGGWVPDGTLVELDGGHTAVVTDGVATFERQTRPTGTRVRLLGVERRLP